MAGLWAAQVQAQSEQSGPPNAGPSTGQVSAPVSTSEISPICTDRPTKSNVPCTVDEGHWQYETDIFNVSIFRAAGTLTDTYLITNPTLKYGLSKSIDLEVNLSPYEIVRTRGADGAVTSLAGIGDLYLRAKDNVFTSRSGAFSVALIPYLKAPTARLGIGNGAVEGGEITSFSVRLTSALTLVTVPEIDVLKNANGDGRHVNTVQLVNLGYTFPHNLEVYAELWADWNFDPTGVVQQASADVAVQWGVTKYLQLDAGLNVGLNRATPGLQPYVGVSQKF